MLSPLCPVDVRVLDAARGQQALRDMLPKGAKVLALASRARSAELNLTPFWTALQSDGHAVQLYSEIPTNPSVADVAALLCRLREEPFEPGAILTVGGGSCIDLGKAVSALYGLPSLPTAQAVRDAIANRAYAPAPQRAGVYAMPTTAGTGSEVTRWATVWDADNRRKLSVDDPDGFPKGAVLIPEWTLGMSPSLTLSTGLDALSHAMEAYWAAARNPLSQELALSAARKVCEALPKALAAPGDLGARREMCLASLMAGLAFSQTRTTACHSISYPLTMLKGVPHGYAAAVTLSSVMRRNAKAVPEMERLEAVFDEAEGLDAWLEDLTKGVQPLRLSAFGIAEADLPAINALTFTAGRMDNNPIGFTPDDVMEILRENL
ncbi:MAG TPA: phosphonoacetaldehyde reductase [Candidatus Limiplasma sp.]|nr:phosphonoacetaldehyde reductase [Candidatus Limiplasma sp.]HPS80710.1 phosphonoacetaldehyde reductase [Candidatus Limiplasma sp.]